MNVYRCINKIKEDNDIKYVLVDNVNHQFTLSRQQILANIISRFMYVTNLDVEDIKADFIPDLSNTKSKVVKLVLKLKTIGAKIDEVYTYCNHVIYCAYMGNKVFILIPDDVLCPLSDAEDKIFLSPLNKVVRNFDYNTEIKVIGGNGLLSTANLLYACKAREIDVSELCTDKVTIMQGMFAGCETLAIKFGDFNTKKVITMERMFCDCQIENLDLTMFDITNVQCLNNMFTWARIHNLDLSSFNFENKPYVHNMLYETNIRNLTLKDEESKNYIIKNYDIYDIESFKERVINIILQE